MQETRGDVTERWAACWCVQERDLLGTACCCVLGPPALPRASPFASPTSSSKVVPAGRAACQGQADFWLEGLRIWD